MAEWLNDYMVEKGWKGFCPGRTGYFSPMATPWVNMKPIPFFRPERAGKGLEGLKKGWKGLKCL
jgi:hypothetical protein